MSINLSNIKKNLYDLLRNNYIIFIFLIIFSINYLCNIEVNQKIKIKQKIKGGEKNCNINYINGINPTENNIIIYYAGKIYDIKKNNLIKNDENQKKYYRLLQKLVKDGYKLKLDNTNESNEYVVEDYKDLTKFFNYYELYQRQGRIMDEWEELYEEKTNIINFLNEKIDVKDIICINDIK